MRVVSIRLDDLRAKKLDKIFAFYGFTDPIAGNNFKAMIDMLSDITENRINSQTVNNQLAKHQDEKVNIDCPLRIVVPQIVKVLKGENTASEYQNVYFCIQWKNGTVKRQLKLISPLVCEICSLLRERAVEEPDILPEQPITIPAAAPAPKPITQRSRPETLPEAKWLCDKTGEVVYYTVCLKCRKDSYLTYRSCLLANHQIALALAYWQKNSSQ